MLNNRGLRRMFKAVVPAPLQPPALAERYLDRLRQSDRILAGPFAGMRFTWELWDPYFSLPLAKYFGTYELELHQVVERLLRAQFDLVVDVGAAEGYYAIGFAARCPGTRVVAYEELAQGRALMARLADANRVTSRLDIRGRCEPADLGAALDSGRRCLDIMDVEGYESVLLDPAITPALRGAHILVEAHDCYAPGVAGQLRERFAPTHRIETIEYRPRRLRDIAAVSKWLQLYARHNVSGWMNERLHPVTWLYLEPRS